MPGSPQRVCPNNGQVGATVPCAARLRLCAIDAPGPRIRPPCSSGSCSPPKSSTHPANRRHFCAVAIRSRHISPSVGTSRFTAPTTRPSLSRAGVGKGRNRLRSPSGRSANASTPRTGRAVCTATAIGHSSCGRGEPSSLRSFQLTHHLSTPTVGSRPGKADAGAVEIDERSGFVGSVKGRWEAIKVLQAHCSVVAERRLPQASTISSMVCGEGGAVPRIIGSLGDVNGYVHFGFYASMEQDASCPVRASTMGPAG